MYTTIGEVLEAMFVCSLIQQLHHTVTNQLQDVFSVWPTLRLYHSTPQGEERLVKAIIRHPAGNIPSEDITVALQDHTVNPEMG
jgi:hypothetical protein